MTNHSDLEIFRNFTEDNIEIYTNITFEPNSSYEVENCIKNSIQPQKISYKFDFLFDDNDYGWFEKDNLKVEINYSVMTDFIFRIDKIYKENDIQKIENWVLKIVYCLLEKENLKK